MDRLVHALDSALAEKWEEAQSALEDIDEPVAGKLRMLVERSRRCGEDNAIASSEVRHALGNLLTVAQANIEGMVDGVVDPSPARLENVRKALTEAVGLISERSGSRAGANPIGVDRDPPAHPHGHVSKLEESLVVRCPYSSARRYLESDMLPEVGAPGLRRLILPLRGAQVSKSVVVMITPGEDPMHMEQPWHVRWTPEGGGPYPDFDGELTVRADEDWDSALLELRGVYSPPGGAIGRVFDRTIGTRIASSTARALLEEIADSLETRYREQEAAKNDSREQQ